ncbi:DUF20 domain-containing protein [Candidatus Westeberhardia cardiocondylae]|uniref:DUF20 domain-containing protein n=1 Tax=Candidatus Westeberhardia cardiocondylae TaxID=1594731 RepID=A0A0H5BWE3_9ENTR|nr:AI-2E family transporter [Candidatus Westeberhardia cardiocondylae]MCR3756490.1 hypothetical protein [Candidatus Westeberhardia cardiocondylae]CEN31992.1 DUF20 domain-containing protein [Candidatus Westeberhardia cardiocondylae]
MKKQKIFISHKQLKIISYLIMFSSMILIIPLHLLSCFISGFLIYEIINSITFYFKFFVNTRYTKLIIIIFIFSTIVSTMTIGIINVIHFLQTDIQHENNISAKINNIFTNIKTHIPNFLFPFFPENEIELKNQILNLIESNLITIKNMGSVFLHELIMTFIGLIIGIIITLNKPSKKKTYFIKQLLQRLYYLSVAFKNIVFAQTTISLINTILTSMIILIIFPLFKTYLPYKKTLITLTFIFGLLPIIGNLISNFIITISALSISLNTAGTMILYLVLIHKLEYFLNAKIIGNQIQAKSWELLFIMLLFDAIFGLEGLIIAPIYYAYLKIELKKQNLI